MWLDCENNVSKQMVYESKIKVSLVESFQLTLKFSSFIPFSIKSTHFAEKEMKVMRGPPPPPQW